MVLAAATTSDYLTCRVLSRPVPCCRVVSCGAVSANQRIVLPLVAPDDVVPQTDQDGHRDNERGCKSCQRHEGM